MNLLYLLHIYCVFAMGPVSAEVFTSMAHVHNLVHFQRKILGKLHKVIEAEKRKITAVEKYMQQFTDVFHQPDMEVERFVSHPINAFHLLRHLSVDWEHMKNVLKYDVGAEAVDDIEQDRKALGFPGEEDVKGTAEGFARLQETYQITAEDFADGNISHLSIHPIPALSAADCYMIGHRLAKGDEFFYAVGWLEVALRKFQEQQADNSSKPFMVRKVDILDWLQYSYFRGGNPIRALELTMQLRKLAPDFPSVEPNFEFYTGLIANLSSKEVEEMKAANITRDRDGTYSDGHYEALCRGEEKMVNRSAMGNLNCFYETHNNPYLLLQPAKYEMVYRDPDIYLIHDVATNSQMQLIKQIAMAFLRRAKIVEGGTNNNVDSRLRISKSAFLQPSLHPVISAMNQRMGHVTNLDMSRAEELQVGNYGIGGFYQAHHDYLTDVLHAHNTSGALNTSMGDRIATLLLYMSDVEAGGATVFPRLNLTLFPEKGAASFWYNLHRDGQPDQRTVHAGCPVLVGNKWVSNKWFREVGQKNRPCGLETDSVGKTIPQFDLDQWKQDQEDMDETDA